MRYLLMAVVLVLGACAATPADVQTADIDPYDAWAGLEGRVSPDGSVITCRSIKVTGTRFPIKQCKSEKVWDWWDAYTEGNTQDALDNIQRNRCGGQPGRC